MEQAISVQEMMRGLWRRRVLVAAVFGVALALGVAVVAGLPRVWRASAVMRVDPRRPSPELVQPSVTAPIEDRLRIVRQELFARPLLEKLILEQNLFEKARRRRGMEAAVEELRAMLEVTVEGEATFELAVQGDDPEQVAKIANRLPVLYAEHTLASRAEQARLTAQLFDEELDRIGKQNTELERRIAEFKLAHLGELPEQIEPNLRTIERLAGLKTARSDTLRELARRSAELESSATDADTEVGRLRRRELDLNRDLDLARSQWTGDHPEVLRLGRELETVKAKRAAAEARAEQSSGEKRFLRAQLAGLNAENKALDAQIAEYRARLDNTPKWAHELSVLDRDYEMLRTKYQSLLSRKVEAEVARDLEAKARAGMFQMLSPAAVPLAPYKPDRAAGLALALLGALGLALGVGIFWELKDDSVRRAEQARELEVPVLALVPRIPGAGRRAG